MEDYYMYCENGSCYLQNKITQETEVFHYQKDIICSLENKLYDNTMHPKEVVRLTSQARTLPLPLISNEEIQDTHDVKIQEMHLDAFLVRQSLNLLSLCGLDSIIHTTSSLKQQKHRILLIVMHDDTQVYFFSSRAMALTNIKVMYQKQIICTSSFKKLCAKIQTCNSVPFLEIEIANFLN